MLILGIETSCDETAAAAVEAVNGKIKVLSNVVASQIEIHKKYGGVVPEVAAREHVLNILPVVHEALEEARVSAMSSRGAERRGNLKFGAINQRSPRSLRSLAMTKLDAIAVTVGPGLITSLLVGVETAKSLSFVWNLPLIAVNHIEAHLYSNFINHPEISFPAVALTVSGGHTSLVLMNGHGRYKLLGETRDDAAGEAFDKAAKLLGLGYPGGPAISREAAKWKHHSPSGGAKSKIKNQKSEIILPRPMIESGDFDFSFSGLKTALLYQLKKDKNWKARVPEYAHEFEQAVVETLVSKTVKAAKKYNVKNVMLAGGVAANRRLRERLKRAVARELPPAGFYLPEFKYTTDNAAMIAANGYFKALKKEYTPYHKVAAEANLELKQLN